MVSARKRQHHEVESHVSNPPKELSLLQRIRNTWQFANLCQWLIIFGDVVKINNVEVDELESECLRPYSMALQEIGLSLLKYLSSHRGLTLELFDEYTRRQYISKAPEQPNPFGNDETPAKFAEFDIFQKFRVLHQMTEFIMMNPEKLRERMAELKDAEHDQTAWRIEPLGWDRNDHTYYLLDDNRLYRMMDPPPAPAPPKKNSKKARAAARASKRRRTSSVLDSAGEDGGDEATETEKEPLAVEQDDGLGGMKWECVAVTLDEVREFLATLQKTRDGNEKILRDQVQEHLVPILEGQEEKRKRREKEREKELVNLEKMANAKRSSRIANKVEHQKQEELAREEEKKRLVEEAAARKEEQLLRKMEKERDNRTMSREQRLREREARRLQHEEELAQLSEDSRNLGSGSGRVSERHLQAEIEKNKQALRELEEEEDEWVFDCVCGLHGQVDDGMHSVSCERCNVWQHSKCLGIDEEEAERDDFHFICDPCRRQQEDKDRLRPRIKIKLSRPGASSSAPPASTPGPAVAVTQSQPAVDSSRIVVEIASKPPAQPSWTSETPKPTASDPNEATPTTLPRLESLLQPPHQESGTNIIPVKVDGFASRSLVTEPRGVTQPIPNGIQNPFSSPHPDLSPPNLSPNKSRAYNTIHDLSSPSAGPSRDGHARMINGAPQLVNGGPRRLSATPILPPSLSRPANRSLESPAGEIASLEKPQTEPTTKNGPPVLAAPGLPPASSSPASNLQEQDPLGTPSSSMAMPRIDPAQAQAEARYDPYSSPLPPVHGGLSPTKHSPALAQVALGGIPSSSPPPPILPPVAALSPSPRPQDPTPPIKQG